MNEQQLMKKIDKQKVSITLTAKQWEYIYSGLDTFVCDLNEVGNEQDQKIVKRVGRLSDYIAEQRMKKVKPLTKKLKKVIK